MSKHFHSDPPGQQRDNTKTFAAIDGPYRDLFGNEITAQPATRGYEPPDKPPSGAAQPPKAAPLGIRATRKLADWRESLTKAWAYWRAKAKTDQEGARIDEVFEHMLAEGPDFLRVHANADYRDAPKVHLDRNDIAKLMTAYRAIERGGWKDREAGKHGGTIGRMAMRILETFLFVLYRPGKAICVPYEAIATAAMVSRRTVADALKHLSRLGLLTIIPRRKRIKTELGFKVVQDVNAYSLHPPRGLGALALAVFSWGKDQSAAGALLKGPSFISKHGTEPIPVPESGAKAFQPLQRALESLLALKK